MVHYAEDASSLTPTNIGHSVFFMFTLWIAILVAICAYCYGISDYSGSSSELALRFWNESANCTGAPSFTLEEWGFANCTSFLTFGWIEKFSVNETSVMLAMCNSTSTCTGVCELSAVSSHECLSRGSTSLSLSF